MKFNYRKLIFLSIISLIGLNSFAATEIDFEFGYDKQVFGTEREDKSTSRSYSGSIAFYFLSMTAIEFNYSEEEDETLNIINSSVDPVVRPTSFSQTIKSVNYGVGIRQALASRKSFLIPTISIGWARSKVQDTTVSSYTVVSDNSTVTFTDGPNVNESDSVFASFALKIRLTKRMSLKGSVNTVFEAFKTEEARDQLSYRAGLSWIF